MNRWLASVAERPGWVLLGVLVFTVFSIQGIVDLRTGEPVLKVDPSTDRVLPSEGPERELYERARKLFGADEALVLALGADDVFTVENLDRVLRITTRVAAIEGVTGVTSLSTAAAVRSEGGDLEVSPLLRQKPDEAEAAEIRDRALGNPLFTGTLVAPDGTATILLVALKRMSDTELVESRIVDRIVSAAREEAGDADLFVSGAPNQKTFLAKALEEELAFQLPAILGLIALVLLLSLRTVRGVLLPLATIFVALIWTLGTLGWLGWDLNPVTVIIPALVLTIGFTYALHVVTEFYAVFREASAEAPLSAPEAVRLTLGHLGTPILVTGLTTGVGFISLALNPIPAIREFGLFSLLGVAFTLLAALTLTPATLALLPVKGGGAAPEEEGSAFLDRVADVLTNVSVRHRRAVIGGAVVVLLLSLYGMTQIRVATLFPSNYPEDHPIRTDFEAINERLGGVNEIRILLETDVREGLLEPDTLREIEALQVWLGEQPEVGATRSIVEYVKMLNRVLRDDLPEDYAIPETKRSVSQLLLFGASRATQSLIDARYQTANVMVNVNVGDSDMVGELVDRIETRLDELPSHLQASVTGSLTLLNRVIDDLARGQLLSISAAFLFIYAVLALMFTSLRVGLLALFPNFLPIVVYFGTLGWTGITLNVLTSLVGCLALGIAVDDTIHYFARFNAEAKEHADEKVATRTALRALIRPVTFTTLGLCSGFLVLTTAVDSTQVQFGFLAAWTIFVAWGVDVSLSPALCSGVRIVTLWDVLRLDLGPQPHLEIPLFEGLSLRQARIFALMSDIRRMKAGERLLTEGEWGDDMFLILGGELQAWCERDGKRIDLSTMRRGEVVGEVGYFAYKRSATVDATTDALLIRFDSEDLERLRQRYAKTAAVVFRNLNRVQAKRIVRDIRLIR